MSWGRYERSGSSRRRKRRNRLTGCLLGVIAVGAALLFGALFALAPRDEAPVLTGPDRDRAAAELQDVKKTIADVRRNAKAGVATEFEVTVTDDQLNLWLTEDESIRKSLRERRVEDAWVSIHDGAIHATVLRAVGTITVQVKATLMPELTSGQRIQTRITDMSVGRFGAPRAVAEKLAADIGRLITSKVAEPGVRLTAIKVEDNRITVSGWTGASAGSATGGQEPELPSPRSSDQVR
jgi:hypothetical protein